MKTTTVRIPDDIQEALSLSAGRNYRSLHGEIIQALRHYAIFGADITSNERDRLFYNKPDYKKLAKSQELIIKGLEQTIEKLEQAIRDVVEHPEDEMNQEEVAIA